MKPLLLSLLLIISNSVTAVEEFGGYGAILAQINIDASYTTTKQNAIRSLAAVPSEHVAEFSRHVYKRFLKSQSQSDYTGILGIISLAMLSDVVEEVMLSVSYGYDFLDHEFYLALTPGVKFKNQSAVFDKVANSVKDECELEVWNAILAAKGAEKRYRFNTSCTLIGDEVAGKAGFTKEQLLGIYDKFRDIDGY